MFIKNKIDIQLQIVIYDINKKVLYYVISLLCFIIQVIVAKKKKKKDSLGSIIDLGPISW